ncbi:MAG: hypothetical protein WC553_02475 [Patescibacteria group bacterium]|jgi:hypothetical protein
MAKFVEADREHYEPFDSSQLSHLEGTAWIDVVFNGWEVDPTPLRELAGAEDDRVAIYEVLPERGGGDGGLTLGFWIWTSVATTIGLVAQGFFQEFGKELAQDLLRKIKRSKEVVDLTLTKGGLELYVLMPAGLTDTDADTLAILLNDLTSEGRYSGKVYITYDRETQKLVFISRQA